MWLDDVFIPWERVFAVDPSPEAIPRWLRWHHLCGWLAKPNLPWVWRWHRPMRWGLKENERPRIPGRSDRRGADRALLPRPPPSATPSSPRQAIAFPITPISRRAASRSLKSRQRISEILRIIPGSSLVVAPADRDLNGARDGGRPRRIVRRRWLLRMAAFGLLRLGLGPRLFVDLTAASWPSSCMPAAAWPVGVSWLRRSFKDYNRLANAVLRRSTCRCRRSTWPALVPLQWCCGGPVHCHRPIRVEIVRSMTKFVIIRAGVGGVIWRRRKLGATSHAPEGGPPLHQCCDAAACDAATDASPLAAGSFAMATMLRRHLDHRIDRRGRPNRKPNQ